MKKKYLAIIITCAIFLAGISGFLIYYFGFKGYLPACTEKPFTNYPVDMNRITSITPLGNLNPPGHTFPTDHMYFYTNITMYPDGFEIYAPGFLHVESIEKVEYNPPQGNISEDFTINFYACRDVSGRFAHVNNLSDYLWSKVSGFGIAYGDSVDKYEVAGMNVTRFIKNVNFDVDGGVPLGIAGLGGGYDFWLKDDRIQLNWVNNDWTREFQYAACPLDYFTDPLKSNMTTYLKNYDNTPVFPANYCGRVDFDVANTAQGIWVRNGYSGRPEDNGLSLVYSNFNASLGSISIGYAGNSTWDSRVYTFDPSGTGFKNRRFGEVTNDGNVYFYLCKEFYSGHYTKVIFLKMITNRSIKLQFYDNGGSPLPADPRTYWNESKTILYSR
jgi:hypothetical protein